MPSGGAAVKRRGRGTLAGWMRECQGCRDAGMLAGRDAGMLAGRDAGMQAGRDAGMLAGRDAGMLE